MHARLEIVVCYELLRCATVAFMKIRTITQRELRNDSGAVLREVEAGRTIIVSRNGTPVGELRPIRRRRLCLARRSRMRQRTLRGSMPGSSVRILMQ
jgi:prevent-host-death family protein